MCRRRPGPSFPPAGGSLRHTAEALLSLPGPASDSGSTWPAVPAQPALPGTFLVSSVMTACGQAQERWYWGLRSPPWSPTSLSHVFHSFI